MRIGGVRQSTPLLLSCLLLVPASRRRRKGRRRQRWREGRLVLALRARLRLRSRRGCLPARLSVLLDRSRCGSVCCQPPGRDDPGVRLVLARRQVRRLRPDVDHQVGVLLVVVRESRITRAGVVVGRVGLAPDACCRRLDVRGRVPGQDRLGIGLVGRKDALMQTREVVLCLDEGQGG